MWEPPKLVFKQLPILNRDIPPPVDRWVSSDDRLHIHIWNSVSGQVVLLQGRLLLTNGDIRQINERITPTSDRAVTTQQIVLLDGYLLSLAITPEGTTRRGQTFCQLYLARSPFDEAGHMTLLISHYIETGHGAGWPGGTMESSVEGPGFIYLVTGTDPAAGSEVSETVPTNARWKLRGFICTLVTNATAATRNMSTIVDDGSTAFFKSRLTGGFSNSQSRTAYFLPGYESTDFTFINNEYALVPLLPDLLLFQGWRVRTSTTNLQAGDNYGAPVLLVEEWIEE